jgi:hypothetical protein
MNRPDANILPDEQDRVENDQEVEESEPIQVEDGVEVIDSSVQIASSENEEIAEETDEMLFVQLGDYIIVESTKYHGQTRGVVYYRSLELLRVKPEGVSDTLHDFELEQDEEEGEIYKDEDGVTAIYIIEKRSLAAFVEQQDFRVGQVIDAIEESGSISKSYRIKAVDTEKDSITLHELDDPESEREIVFGFIGIPPEEEIRILSIREFVPSTTSDESNSNSDNNASLRENIEEEEQDEEEDVENNAEQSILKRIVMLDKVEIVKPVIYREAASFEQRIPDHLQKVDALNDFINSLDPSLQKDQNAMRRIRILVETLYHLNKSIIEYDEEGAIRGEKAVSVKTLAELISQTPLPMGRPVLQVKKKIYTTSEDDIDPEEADDQIALADFEAEIIQMIENKSPIVASSVGKKSIVREWLQQQEFARSYRPWNSDQHLQPMWLASTDTEFFRSEIPSTEEDTATSHKLIDTVRGLMASSPPILDYIPFGMERALSTTYRKGAERRKEVLHLSDRAPLIAFLLFPQRMIPYMAKKLSYDLVMDSGRSHMPLKLMKDIFRELGDPLEDDGTSKDILLVKADGHTLGDISLTDYIAGLHLPALGWADFFQTLVHYGLDQYELYKDLAKVLKRKMFLHQSQVKSVISKLRTAISGMEQKPPVANLLLPDATMWSDIHYQDLLTQTIDEYQKFNPTMSESDVGKILYLTKRFDNLFQLTAGKNPLLIAEETRRVSNYQYLEMLKIQSTLRQMEKDAGQRPKPNKCQHVADMVSVKRLTDDSERFYELTKVFKRYQGERKENWFHCNVCKEQFLCIHERLQLQAYLHPREKDTIEKEIILKCSGGQFQGKYICRNCGQSIRDLDFDNNMEYDDEGRPISGRSQLVDEDALLEEEIDELISAPIEQVNPIQWKMTADERQCANVVRILSEKVGVFLDQESYKTIVERTMRFLSKLQSRESYAKGKPKLDYDVFHARHFIAFCSIFLLIDIQTKKPDYVIRYRLQACKTPTFDGYPLDTDFTKRNGIQYLSCAVASTRLKEKPWSATGYNNEKDDVKRMNAAVYYMVLLFPKIMEDPMIQADLAEKRRYMEEVMGKETTGDNIPRDMVFSTFLPDLKTPTAAEAAKNAITPEIAEKLGNQQALVRLWIRRAHQIANDSKEVIYGSPFLETTCCVSTLESPQEKWKEVSDLPDLPSRRWTPFLQGSALVTHFMPRAQDSAVAEADKGLFYRVFLKYCFKGPRVGHPHEANLTHRCLWCGFQFPSHPKIMDAEQEGKPALITQEVSTDTESFTTLLDTIHTVYEVSPELLPSPVGFTELMTDFGAIQPPPIEQWSAVMEETIREFKRLNHNASPEELKSDIALAMGAMSDVGRFYQDRIQSRVSKKYMEIMEEIVRLPWNNFFQILQTYFSVPFHRILSGFDRDSLFIPVELRMDLSDQHATDLKGMMDVHLRDLSKIPEDWATNSQYDLARAKMRYYSQQMGEIMAYKERIRAIRFPGRQTSLEYIQRVLFFGPLGMMLDSYHIPQDAVIMSAVKEISNPSIDFLLQMILTSISKYNREKLSYDDDRIRYMIAVKEEMERVHVIKEFDKLTDEERAIEKMNKKLGLGKWAVGGTKLIWAYDKEYYDQERLRRLDAGMIDFEGVSTGENLPPSGREYDEFGLPVFSDMDSERDGGYDFAQHGDDD